MSVTQTEAQKAGYGNISREADDVYFATIGNVYMGVGAGSPAGVGGTDTIPTGSTYYDQTAGKMYIHQGSGVWSLLGVSGIESLTAKYDFAVGAGTIGDVLIDAYLPAGALVTDIIAEEDDTLTSGGSATIHLLVGTTSLVAAAAFDSYHAAITALTLQGSVAAIKSATKQQIKVTIAVAGVTAGSVNYHIKYINTAGV